jgi:hypothetical protein
LFFVNQHTEEWATVIICLVAGISFGALMPGMAVGMQATVDENDASQAMCLATLLRPAGQCLGVAIGLAIFSTQLDLELLKRGFPDGLAQKLMQTIREPLPDTGPNGPIQKLKVDAVIKALSVVWVTGTCFAGIAGILAVCANCPKLPENFFDDYIDNEDPTEDEGNSAQNRDRVEDPVAQSFDTAWSKDDGDEAMPKNSKEGVCIASVAHIHEVSGTTSQDRASTAFEKSLQTELRDLEAVNIIDDAIASDRRR